MNPFSEVERARRWLRARPRTSRAVHEARKSLRRARALLRLGRGSAVEGECRRADAACRRAARALAPLRDARVFADTLGKILARAPEGLPAEARLRGRALALRARRAEARGLARGAAFRRARAALGACPPSQAGARFVSAVSSASGRRLRKAFRRGRRDYRAVRSSPDRGGFHDLRKESKTLLHELEELKPRAGAIPELRRLAKVLGDEHDLSLLRDRLGGAPAALRRLARRRQRRLRRRALVLAKGLYAGHGRNVAMIGG